MIKKLKTKEFIPLGSSILLMIISVVKILTTNTTFTEVHYLGMVSLIVSTVLFFRNERVYLFFFGSSIFLGLLDFVEFFYVTIKVGFGNFQVNLVFLILLFLFIITSERILNILFPKEGLEE